MIMPNTKIRKNVIEVVRVKSEKENEEDKFVAVVNNVVKTLPVSAKLAFKIANSYKNF